MKGGIFTPDFIYNSTPRDLIYIAFTIQNSEFLLPTGQNSSRQEMVGQYLRWCFMGKLYGIGARRRVLGSKFRRC